jgi:hypothetical protein
LKHSEPIAGCARRKSARGFATIDASSMSESRLPSRTQDASTSQSAIRSASNAAILAR